MRALQAILIPTLAVCAAEASDGQLVPPWTRNHLLNAQLSGNIEAYNKGLRGAADHMVYDFEKEAFRQMSHWHEYGVAAGANLGVVEESSPAWWMAEWDEPVLCNLMTLSGCYPNQPQPDTSWKIELRSDGVWQEHARGVGGWYDNGRFIWRVPAGDSIMFDGFRVSVFSKDGETPLRSIHFRGEAKVSWVVASVPDFDAILKMDGRRVRLGESVRFEGIAKRGEIHSWKWDFGDGESAIGNRVDHVYAEPGTYKIALDFASGENRARLHDAVIVGPPIEARITPLQQQVRVRESFFLDGSDSQGGIKTFRWAFDDGVTASGRRVDHVFEKPGIYKALLTVSDGSYTHDCAVFIRAHDADTRDVPQLLLDTDQKNEQDDQYYLGYSVFSELDILGVNSVHHGGGQEPINYAEILHVLDLAERSGAKDDHIPRVFRGANERLAVPDSGRWTDTAPIDTPAAQAILAAARGASPEQPVWIVPVGPGTNVASAILLAGEQGLELRDRVRVMWLGGSKNAVTSEFNGNNDPWSIYVAAQSGVECWIMPAPVGARVRIDKRTESALYPDHPLGRYLEEITPAHNKPLFDPATISAIIDMHIQAGWVKEAEDVTVGGPEDGFRWRRSDGPTNVKIIREIDQAAMKRDIFDTLKGKPQRLGLAEPQQDAVFRPAVPRTFTDVHYGPHERNLMDVWLAESDAPTPVLVSIHGGAFRHGERKVSNTLLRECLASGISVVAITYRFSDTDIAPAQFHDAARAVQFIRHHAEHWNVDPTRIASTGGSAGAGLSLWLGFHDDMADPANADPVLRQSTRLTCMAVDQGQCSYDPRFIRDLFPENDTYQTSALAELFDADLKRLDDMPAEKCALFEEVSPITHLTGDDAPVLMTYVSTMETPISDRSIGIHHPRFGVVLKERMDALNLECQVHTGIERGNPERSRLLFSFIKKHLFERDE
jgi:acetyl esterase/lipase